VAIVVPLVITFVILQMLFGWMDGVFAPLLAHLIGMRIPGLGILTTFLLIWLVGLITASVIGRRLVLALERLLFKTPLVKTIYAPTKQLIDAVVDPSKHGFKQVMMVEYPRPGSWTIGFLTGETPRSENRPPALNIFIATAPNPITGIIVIVPPERVRPTTISVEEAIHFIVSGGVVVPPLLPSQFTNHSQAPDTLRERDDRTP